MRRRLAGFGVWAIAAGAAPAASAQAVVSVDWLRPRLDSAEIVVLHAAMDSTEYRAGHIPGARFASIMSFHAHGSALPDPAALAAALGSLGVANRSRVVIAGSPMNAALLYVALDYVGHGARSHVLDGGLTAWRAAGGRVSTRAMAHAPARFEARVNRDLVVDATWLDAQRTRPSIALVDARSGAEYAGISSNDGLPRSGHIPGAGHLDWVATLDRSGSDSGAMPADAALLPRAALEEQFRAAGVSAGETVVAYCTVGMRASHLYLVARHLGYPARLYVGSMADWTARPDRPVTKGGRP